MHSYIYVCVYIYIFMNKYFFHIKKAPTSSKSLKSSPWIYGKKKSLYSEVQTKFSNSVEW